MNVPDVELGRSDWTVCMYVCMRLDICVCTKQNSVYVEVQYHLQRVSVCITTSSRSPNFSIHMYIHTYG